MTEKRVMTEAARRAIAAGFAVSVSDGERWVARRSTSPLEIVKASDGLDECHWVVRRQNGERVGAALLAFGNDPDGSELFADHTDNEEMRAMLE